MAGYVHRPLKVYSTFLKYIENSKLTTLKKDEYHFKYALEMTASEFGTQGLELLVDQLEINKNAAKKQLKEAKKEYVIAKESLDKHKKT